MKITARLAALLFLGTSGCSTPSVQCPLTTEQPMTVNELFFGRAIPGRAPLTENEWSEFVASIIAKEFPDGFTVLDGDGEWRDPVTNKVESENTKILVVATIDDPDKRIERVINDYRRAYTQRSVGVLTYKACGEFGK